MDDIDNRFEQHTIDEGQSGDMAAVRGAAKALARVIAGRCPDSREKSLAMTKLEECSMWANASIARNGGE